MSFSNDIRIKRPSRRYLFVSRPAVLAGIAVVILFVFLLTALRWLPQTAAIVHMRMISDAAGSAQWYFDRGQGYSEPDSVVARLRVGVNDLQFKFPTGNYRSIRFDPINNSAHVKITYVEWRTADSQTAERLTSSHFIALANIDRVAVDGEGMDVWPIATSEDPQLALSPAQPVDLTQPIRSFGVDVFGAFELSVVLVALASFLFVFVPARWAVGLGMTLASGLILAMIVMSTTKGSVHPDEFSHLGAYQFFTDHWLPPSVSDPATIPSTSVWGFSYLFELDVVYDIAAQVTAPLRLWLGDDLLAARFFQFALWGILIAMTLRRKQWAWTLSLLLVSPQVWYVFSYMNADAFPLCLSFIVACLLADENGGAHRFLRGEGWRQAGLFVAAICLGLVLVSKRNYLPIFPVFLLWLAVIHLNWRTLEVAASILAMLFFGVATFAGQLPVLRTSHFLLEIAGALLGLIVIGIEVLRSARDPVRRTRTLRIASFAAMCIVVALPRFAWDLHINGSPSQKSELVRSVEEVRAGHDFKPSVIASGNGNSTVALASRGVRLNQVLFEPYGWVHSSAESFFGVYGYMNIVAPGWLYGAFLLNAFLMLVLMYYAMVRNNSRLWPAFASVVTGGCLLVLSSSLLLSWFDQLQPQGRYLFPALPIIALMLGCSMPVVPKRIFQSALFLGFLLSLYSYLFIALPPFIDAR